MPDDQATEKKALLERLGVAVTVVPNCSIANKDHYVNTARRLAKVIQPTHHILRWPSPSPLSLSPPRPVSACPT